MVTQQVELPISTTDLLLRCAQRPYAFALDGGSTRSWGTGKALLGFAPRARLQVAAGGDARVYSGGTQEQWSGDPFALLDRFHSTFRPAATITALSYELRHWVERLPSRAASEDPLPVLHAAAYDWVIAYSYKDGTFELLGGDFLDSLAAAAAALQELVRTPLVVNPLPRLPIESSFTPKAYADAVQAILEYIAAGDVYQVNLAQRFSATCPGLSASSLYAFWQAENPMPFSAYVDCGELTLVSNSPECFVRRQGDAVATFPIKGTRPRGSNEAVDAEMVAALRQNPKELAEHVMIVDLERNDLGKICRIGSVNVDDLGRIETYPKLHHAVSRVAGVLVPGTSTAELLRSLFPGGSITGAPKIRAMEIIDEIEPVPRGFYTGAIGALLGEQDACFNIAIRTATVGRERVSYHAGGGIVADSRADAEFAESLLKAEAFFSALGGRHG